MNIEVLKNKIKSKRKIILIVTLIAITAIIIYIINMNNIEENFLINELSENLINEIIIENTIIKETESIPKNTIIIHIAGEVKNNGIVEIEEGQRIIDAIEKAGGTTAQADLSKINLAYVLSDGQRVYIPKINENYTGEYVTSASSTEESNDANISTSTSKSKTNQKTIVNINTASVEELQNLQGIGESIAKKIVEYRKDNGKFNSVEDIKNVSGIGESKYNKIKDYICVKN